MLSAVPSRYPHVLPRLPYSLGALEPAIGIDTVKTHYEKHHQGYVTKLNGLLANEDDAKKQSTLEDLIRSCPPDKPLFNNAGQIWNHTFYWNSMTEKASVPSTQLESRVVSDFGSMMALRQKFSEVAVSQFGSGWAWLVSDAEGRLSVIATPNAHSPLTKNLMPLVTCDVWEHAYYLDYKNLRPKYVEAFWDILNWDFASKNYSDAGQCLQKSAHL